MVRLVIWKGQRLNRSRALRVGANSTRARKVADRHLRSAEVGRIRHPVFGVWTAETRYRYGAGVGNYGRNSDGSAPAVSVIVTVPPELLMLTVLPLLSLTEEGYDKTALTPLFPVILKLENEYTVPSL